MRAITSRKSVILFFITAFSLIAAQAIIEGNVIGITDGDTIRILRGKEEIKVRLYGIDCPEKKQAFGSRAKQYASELVFRKNVKVISHGNDRYGRVIGEVILEDGRSLNKEMLKAGMAWWYEQYAKNEAEYSALQDQARKDSVGLWIDRSPIPPWEFRKIKRAK